MAMKYRLRFETFEQYKAFLKGREELSALVMTENVPEEGNNDRDLSGNTQNGPVFESILPVSVLEKHPEVLDDAHMIAEIPSIVWPSMEDKLQEKLNSLKASGLKSAMADNIGAIGMCRTAGLAACGGFGLNILNSVSLDQYAQMGLKDALLSIELGFPSMRKIHADIPSGYIGYGYLPLMKFRACPMKGPKGCGNCTGFNHLTDRTDTRFPLICRDRQYSELLNHLPVYTADKGGPELDFECLYFTIERPDAVPGIISSYVKKETPQFLRTAGLYQRKLL